MPSRRVCNDEIIDLIKFYSRQLSKKELSEVTDEAQNLLNQAGSQTRSWRLDYENPEILIAEAFTKASEQSHIAKNEIDGVIYASIHRLFLEPASASSVCDRLGIKPKHSFDILDACMGWCSAIEVAKQFLFNGIWKNALIITSEFPIEKNGVIIPGCFSIKSPDELETKFAGLTMGEGATATFLSASEKDWSFTRCEEPGLSSLCTVPLRNMNSYQAELDKLALNGPDVFSAKALDMAKRGFRPGVQVFKEYIAQHGIPDVIIPHSVSTLVPLRAAQRFGLGERVFNTFSELGNLSTSSVPTSICAAIHRNRITQNDHLAGWIASAGMKFCAMNIHLHPQLLMSATDQVERQKLVKKLITNTESFV
ncbi:3-oxoacyl-[acyl-carrier-protein] synthase III C-terminal domain-containing protein [Maridesulfovibrio frigidus]|uniref:3-oxoacyl-[acyl-carrier-protein] synthase III C-terminal domain-containing protein n=1 Tax=Maridesulfovibrio frigidus TaxID=340956 RepID=UPI0004E12029|nr:3-oxoacyl-[acyl-carrier-protein] synthase III C-terminal domain-containing protein [Maridesulfovibrio frigidus]